MILWVALALASYPPLIGGDPVPGEADEVSIQPVTGRAQQWLLDQQGPGTARVTWRQKEGPWLYQVGREPTALQLPIGIDAMAHRRLLPGVAVGPGHRWVALRFPSGPVAMFNPQDGSLQWAAQADVNEVQGPHVSFEVAHPPPPSSWMPGSDDVTAMQVGHPWSSPDGKVVVAVGEVGDGPNHIVHAWDVDTGSVRHRFTFDAPTWILGLRRDGRLVVRSSRTVFALSLELPMGEPDVVATEVLTAKVVDGEVVTSGTSP